MFGVYVGYNIPKGVILSIVHDIYIYIVKYMEY